MAAIMSCLKLAKFQTENFRNLGAQTAWLAPGINCIFGDNGNGKTNLLEAIYFLATQKSFRKNAGFPQMLGMDGGKPEIIFSAVFTNQEDQQIPYSGKVTAEGSVWFYDRVPVKKRPRIPVVLINPFDAHHFFFTAQFRRSWFDLHLAQISEEYKRHWSYYQKALKQRNSLLAANLAGSDGQLKALTTVLAQSTAKLLPWRQEFTQQLAAATKRVFQQLFNDSFDFKLQIKSPFLNCSLQQILDLYLEKLEIEKIAKHTLRGLHRDDYQLFIGDFQAEEYASMGQQKCAYLALEFAYIELFRYKFNAYPIVLIDDVSGELDQARWFNLVSYLRRCNFQVLITTANEKFRETLQKIGKINELKITAGEIQNLSTPPSFHPLVCDQPEIRSEL